MICMINNQNTIPYFYVAISSLIQVVWCLLKIHFLLHDYLVRTMIVCNFTTNQISTHIIKINGAYICNLCGSGDFFAYDLKI